MSDPADTEGQPPSAPPASAPPTSAPPTSSLPASALLTPEADDAFSAFADRTRRRVLVRLAEQPDDAGAVARDLGLSRQAVAKHLRILVTAGVARVHTDRRRQVHTVDPGRICEVSDLLGTVSRGWDRRLAQVREIAEESARDLR